MSISLTQSPSPSSTISTGAFMTYNQGQIVGYDMKGRTFGGFIQKKIPFGESFLGLAASTSSGRIRGVTNTLITIPIIPNVLSVPVNIPLDFSMGVISKGLLQLGTNFGMDNVDGKKITLSPYIEAGLVLTDANVNLVTTDKFYPFVPGYTVGAGFDFTLGDNLSMKVGYNFSESPNKEPTLKKKIFTLNDYIVGWSYQF